MKIIWLNWFRAKSDDNPTEESKDILEGGAEITVKHFEIKGKELGHDVNVMTPLSIDMDKVKEADLVILSNTPTGVEKHKFNIEDIDYVIENKDYVKLEHDNGFCQFRNVQCDDYCKINKCKPFFHRKLMDKAKALIFLSPLQEQIHRKFFWKEMTKEKVAFVPPCIKKTMMKESKEARQKGTYCVVGAIYAGKGIDDILEQYKVLGKNLRFIGNSNDVQLTGRIAQSGHTLVPPVPHKEMPSVFQKYEYMIMSRRIRKTNERGIPVVNEKEEPLYTYMNEGFGRIIPEALNCGIRILVDKESMKRIGAYSYGWTDDEIVENCDKADDTFWDILKEKGLLK